MSIEWYGYFLFKYWVLCISKRCLILCSKENPKTAELVKPAKLDKATSKSRRTPFKLFSDYNSLLGNALSTSEMRNEYNKLSIDAKYKWIEKSVKMYPDVGQSSIISF